ncbi:DNA polymerase III subunit gamma and tau [Herbiconiux sp. CPCC 205763]|uniref:DNA-directed DNA polymerase n=1 Tax=Herbiconiux aconitum TaxID=2970913 RepID=A0ABT2GPF4_9MICO|nr:DNA polymerase III subunit gamma and tau [Herbiconiux aconitum]MCS5716809.1 DNA polymerase III subunit gamma and tau [Herbiconiux aconitum]
MVTALYRRYRPENFAEMIGQSQVTDPLMTALRTNRVNHAYLFSGPRGCGKTTSARILARCLNCAEGPTDKPCGVCPSCVELSRDGMGSLDVVEIDAASHGGVDDARDLRERAVFAPARDRYKIFIIDEAHMVTSGGFNALLKIVEEPPEHIKFIFATTEPDKVIGTIRSRTHHYPFRLIPPAQLLEYVQQLCETEGVEVAPGVLPLVVRAGGGSARDTLSLLDQLIAGSENNRVEYERAVALLGYTHGALLSEVIDAIGAHDGAASFEAVDRVIQTGQDPRRFVEDLLERLRDIIIVSATRESASSVLRGVPAEEIEGMRRQAAMFGHAELSRVADIVNDALTEMTGATSPRLHLELMIARTLVPASDDTERGALVRVERLERRIGVDGPDAAVGGAVASRAPAVAETRSPASSGGSGGSAVPAAASAQPVSSSSGSAGSSSSGSAPEAGSAQPASGSSAPPVAATSAPSASGPSASGSSGSGSSVSGSSGSAAASASTSSARPGAATSAGSGGSSPAPAASSSSPGTSASSPAASTPVQAAAGEVTLQQLKDSWPEILEAVQKAKMTAWLVVFTAQVRALDGDVLTLAFPSENDVASFKERSAPGQGVSEYLRQAIVDVLGLRVKYIARVDSSLRPEVAAPDAATPSAAAPDASSPPAGAPDASSPSATGPAAPASAAPASATAPGGAGTDGWAPSAPSAESSPAPTWSTPGVSNPGASVAPPASAPSVPSTAQARPSAGSSASAKGASSGRPQGARGAASAPTTSWDVVAIPTSSDEEPPPFDEPLPSDEPDLPPESAEYGAGAPAATSGATPTGSAAAPAPASVNSPATAGGTGTGPSAVADTDASGSSGSGASASGSSGSGASASADARTPSGGDPAGRPAGTRPSERAARPSGAPDPAARPGALRFEAAPDEAADAASAAPASPSRAPTSPPRPPASTSTPGGRARYGEAVVREILGANFIEEQPLPGREG